MGMQSLNHWEVLETLHALLVQHSHCRKIHTRMVQGSSEYKHFWSLSTYTYFSLCVHVLQTADLQMTALGLTNSSTMDTWRALRQVDVLIGIESLVVVSGNALVCDEQICKVWRFGIVLQQNGVVWRLHWSRWIVLLFQKGVGSYDFCQ